MSFYHEYRITVPGFEDYDLTDLGNVYKKGTTELMVPYVTKSVRFYQNNHGRMLMVLNREGTWYYVTNDKKSKHISDPKKLVFDPDKMYCATITLKWIEHVKYFPATKRGLKNAVAWADELERIYYPLAGR